MSKQRTIIELLQVVIDSLKKGDKLAWNDTGICGEILDLFELNRISEAESESLYEIIKSNKPRKGGTFEKYTKSKMWQTESEWWFPHMLCYPHARRIRINYLTDLKASLS